METIQEFLDQIQVPQHRTRVEEVFHWVVVNFPDLSHKIAWNQPVFTDHGTYIIGFSIAKQHMAIAPEAKTIVQFSEDIITAGYDYTNQIIRIKWNTPVDFSLLKKIIEFNIMDKKDCSTFWRK